MSDQGGMTDDEASSEAPTPFSNQPQPQRFAQPAGKGQVSGTSTVNGQRNAQISTTNRRGVVRAKTAGGQSSSILPAEKVFPIQVGTELFRLSGASISSDGPSYFTQFFEEQVRQNEDSGGVRTLYIDRDPATFRDIARHLQGYYVKPNDGTHFVRLFADAQFYSLPRLITQLFDSEIFIQIGEEHFQIPKDLFSDPGNSPNFFSLGFAVFFSTPGDVFPGLDKRGLLRPPPINPPHVSTRSSAVFAEILHMLRGYPLEIRDETHRAQLLRDCRYFHLRGLEQKIIAHEISYNLERKRTEICIRLEDIKPSGISYQAEGRENPMPLSQATVGGGWVYYSRPFVDETPYELIIEVGNESTEIDLGEGRAIFHGISKARMSSLLQVIANKMNLPANVPLGLIMLSGGSPSPAASPGSIALSDDMVKIQFENTSAVILDGQPYNPNQIRESNTPLPIATMDDFMTGQIPDDRPRSPIKPTHKGASTRNRGQSHDEDVPPHKRRRISEPSPDVNRGKWIVRNGQWRLRLRSTQDPARSGYELILVAVKIDAFSSERARNARRTFLTG